MTHIPSTADVVVIGGGPAGTAALWALDRMQPGIKTVLLEKAPQLGSGSSTASLENYRSCWPALPMARQMARSIEVLLNADTYLGEGAANAIHPRTNGYLFCGFNDQHADALRADVTHLHAIGLTHIEYLDAAEVAHRYGWLGPRVIAAKFDPRAGWVDSNALIHRYAQQARSAQIVLDVPDVQIRVQGGRVQGVTTPLGAIDAPVVLIAAGANSRKVGRSAGIELPLVVRPRQSFTTRWRHETFPEDSPMIIGSTPHPHVRPEARDGAIFGWENTWRPRNLADEYGTNTARDAIIDPIYPPEPLKDPRFPSLALALLARQFGHAPGEGFGDTRYLRGLYHNIGYYTYRDETAAYRIEADGTWRGYDSERAIIDRHPDVEGLVVSIAHVGHGIMTSPASGEIAAAHILGQDLPDPVFAEFGFAANWVEYDEAVL